jgi:hypothetical protein
MKRLVSGLVAAAALVALAGPAGAQTGAKARGGDGDARVRFYEFGEFDITGGRRTPALTAFDGRQRVRFERLARLKKSFVPALVESGKGPGYR